MHRLQAEESLSTIAAVSAGNVTLKESARDKLLRRLRLAARGGRRERAQRPESREAWLAGLAARGIQVQFVKPRGDRSNGQNTAQAGASAGGGTAEAGGRDA